MSLETPFADRAMERVPAPGYLWLDLGSEAPEQAEPPVVQDTLGFRLYALGILALLCIAFAVGVSY